MSVDNMQQDPATANQRPSNALSSSSKKRSLAKTLSWRVTATTTTFLIAWLVTGDIATGAAIGGVEAVAKMFLYYGHERAWERVTIS
ncbi:MAG: putative membrane protein [Ilumatobacter sp.]|jgi:uncharacterized membrane protein